MTDDLGAIALVLNSIHPRRYLGIWQVSDDYLIIRCGPRGGNREIVAVERNQWTALTRWRKMTEFSEPDLKLARLREAVNRLDFSGNGQKRKEVNHEKQRSHDHRDHTA